MNRRNGEDWFIDAATDLVELVKESDYRNAHNGHSLKQNAAFIELDKLCTVYQGGFERGNDKSADEMAKEFVKQIKRVVEAGGLS